jgi:tRNA isopentenyl-2-thiomethyl-A-37 hydroxylase MiaE
VPAHRNLYWKLNWYRHSELEGALLLGKVVRAAADQELILALTRHCAEEAHHAWLWADTLHQMRLPFVRIFRSYQSFYLEHAGMPLGLAEVLALTHVFERRVHWRFTQELAQPRLPAPVRRTFRVLLKDERRHLDWVGRWLATQPEGADLLRRFQAIDEQVYLALAPYTDRIWDIPGLGEESGSVAHADAIHQALVG